MALENFPTRETARDMMEMVSPIYDRSYVAKWLYQVMALPMELARDTVKGLEQEAFPETATWTLPWWEQRYGIAANSSLTIDERRAAIVKKRNYKRPMNPYRIAILIPDLCGRPVEVRENVAPHTYEVVIMPGSTQVIWDEVANTIHEVKQAQKHVRIVCESQVTVQIRPEYDEYLFPHVMAGTRPDINRIGVSEAFSLEIKPEETGRVFTYRPAGKDKTTGTYPDTSTIGRAEEPGINACITGESSGIVYKICGAVRL